MPSKKDSGTVCQEDAGSEDGRRPVYIYSVKGQHRWCYPSHFRIFPDVDSADDCAFTGANVGTGIGATLIGMLSQNNWFNFSHPVYSIGLVLYIVLNVFFAYFYTSITFNPIEVADNMKKQEDSFRVSGPGKPTQEYLEKVLNYLVFIGAAGLIIVVLIPIFFNGVFGASVSFGGTSIIIIVGVILETLKQIESQMLVRNYKGFLSE